MKKAIKLNNKTKSRVILDDIVSYTAFSSLSTRGAKGTIRIRYGFNGSSSSNQPSFQEFTYSTMEEALEDIERIDKYFDLSSDPNLNSIL